MRAFAKEGGRLTIDGAALYDVHAHLSREMNDEPI